MPRTGQPSQTTERGLWSAPLIGFLVFGTTWLGIIYTRQANDVVAIWPGNAIVVAAFARTPRKSWSDLILAGLIGNLAGNLAAGNSLSASLLFPACNSAEVTMCGLGLRGFLQADTALRRRRDFWIFALSCTVAATASALVGAAIAGLYRLPHPGRAIATWALADTLGLLILTPTLMWLSDRSAWRTLAAPRPWSALGLCLGFALMTAAIFMQSRYALLFCVTAAMLILAFELETLGASIALLLTTAIGIGSSMAGFGPTVAMGAERIEAVLSLQIFLAASAVLILGAAATLAESRRLREALAESDSRYRMLVDRTSDVILRYDPRGVIEYVSPAIRTLGYTPEAMVGRNMAEFVHPDNAEETRRNRQAVTQGALIPEAERHAFRALRADGDWVWLQGNPSPLYDAAGQPVGAVTVLRDVSERKALELELVRQRQEAEAATVAKSEFLANMSHEIRTPLTGIIGFTALLEDVPALPPAAAAYVRRIATAGQALLSVVNDVLDFSKVDAGQIELDPHPFDPKAFLADTLDLVAAQAGAKGLSLESHIQGEPPKAAVADSARARQVLLNLLTNALKFTKQGGVRVTMTYFADDGGRLRFEVSDTGIGVPPELAHRLFQRFSQIDGSITRQFGGTGLGLAICKGLVAIMDGDIGMESRVGGGSTFWFTFAAPAANPVASAAAPAPAALPERPLHILVVDDVEMNRALVSAMLGPFDVRLTEAVGGAEAIEAALQTRFDLILMDLQMPGVDGLAATRAIRAHCDLNQKTPIIALSANVLPTHLSDCQQAGMNDHIAKPIRPEDLLGKVARWAAPDRSGAQEDIDA